VKCRNHILVLATVFLYLSDAVRASEPAKNPAESGVDSPGTPQKMTDPESIPPAATRPAAVAQSKKKQSLRVADKTRGPLEGPETTDETPAESGAAAAAAQLHQPSDRYPLERSLIPNLLSDQKAFWTRPARPAATDVRWLIPLVASTSFLIGNDAAIESKLPGSPDSIRRSRNFSNLGTASLVGAAGTLYFWGHLRNNDRARETGWLSGEALMNTFLDSSILQLAAGRNRPLQGNGKGEFWQGGSSFPSEHAAAAWSVASVIAHEYPGFLTQLLAYGTAAGISASRVTGGKHFAADALIGSALGWYMGRQVYRAHHDPELGGTSFGASFNDGAEHRRNPENMGSPYVPLDSWVYPAFDRLAALGLVSSGLAGMRPWTRLECARLGNEAAEAAGEDNPRFSESSQLVAALQHEFASELDERGVAGNSLRLRMESVYTRVTGISGPPLDRSYDFGQTILNDFGRPFAEGVNNVTGLSGWAAAGPLVVYVRGEYQYAPASSALPQGARQLISTLDFGVPVPPNSPTPAVNHFQLLDAYVAINLNHWQLSFGKQSLWWGPSQGGPLMFSDNAVPVTMLRLDRASPFKLPSILGLLGPMRTQLILGQLSGQEFVYGNSAGLIGQWGTALNPQPFMDGVKLSFKPTPNFEFGVSKTTLVGGPGMPFTLHKFLQSMFSIKGKNGAYGTSADAGDRRSEVDFSYKIPKLRNWLTLYGDAFTEDEFSPLGYPRKSVYQGGVYMPQLPWIPKLDLRIEGGATSPPDFSSCNGCFYGNGRFLSGFTNQGNIMGSWLGRGAQGEQVWSTYWLSAKNKIQFNYRHRKADSQFIAGGGTVNDATVKADLWLNARAELSGSVQYEAWNFPVLAPGPQSNLTTSVQLTFWPHSGR
jgi:membrane-associated phospholipid phosphatase